MLSKVRTAREMQVVGKFKSELMKVIDKLQRVNLNSAVETLITEINVAVSSSVDRQKLLVIVQSRQSGDDDDSELSALAEMNQQSHVAMKAGRKLKTGDEMSMSKKVYEGGRQRR